MSEIKNYKTRVIYLAGDMQKETAMLAIKNAPVDMAMPLEVVIRPRQPLRKPDQNALMWSGPLKDIAEQAWVNGRTYSAEVWHEHFKRDFLPEEYIEGITKEGYRKWDISPSGDRVLVGSTKDLTKKGFSDYLEQVYAFGAGLGVQFSAGRLAA
jgi:hypothetical protein